MLPTVDMLTRRALGAALCLMPELKSPQPIFAAETPPTSGFETRSGLKFIDFREGNGQTPRFGQLIRFHYVGYTLESVGSKSLSAFDSSYERKTPYFTKHGNGYTCQGLEEAIHTMSVGGRRRVILPPVLGYTGDKGPLPPKAGARKQLFGAVSAGQPVVFDLELVAVVDDLLDRGDYDDLSMEEVRVHA